jgi:hypothetical protein
LQKENRTGHTVIASGKASMVLAPGKKGVLQLSLPSNWQNADALSFTAIDLYNHEIYTWTWPLKSSADVTEKYINDVKRRTNSGEVSPVKEIQQGNIYSIIKDASRFNFDTSTGYLESVYKFNKSISFGGGPVLAGVKQMLQKFHHYKTADNNFIVEASYSGDATMNVKWIFTAGMPVKLEYRYTQTAAASFYGISFNIDESKITGIKWLGDGPYRVWKNRRKAVTLNVWEKKYNNTITGETFVYPEFKGYYSNMYWATIRAKESSFTVYTDKEGLFLQLLQPGIPKTTFIPHVNPPFPQGGLGFLNAIAPIGTKFTAANVMGPAGQLNIPSKETISGNLWFDF